ncbi:MAG TPA: hypothetical protein VFS96_05970, partial [Nitrolancea sp.]|nr:hypothetical protein [Nitrolancea sp.]
MTFGYGMNPYGMSYNPALTGLGAAGQMPYPAMPGIGMAPYPAIPGMGMAPYPAIPGMGMAPYAAPFAPAFAP